MTSQWHRNPVWFVENSATHTGTRVSGDTSAHVNATKPGRNESGQTLQTLGLGQNPRRTNHHDVDHHPVPCCSLSSFEGRPNRTAGDKGGVEGLRSHARR